MQKIQHTYLHLESDGEFRERLRQMYDVPFGLGTGYLDDWAWNNHKLQRKLIWCQS